MQLLVSVRSAAEVECALAGGADIIDAKEPARGSLGPVSMNALAGILGRLPSSCAFSVALGDVGSDADVVAAISNLDLTPRSGPTFLKLGFAGVTSPELVCRLLGRAVQLAAELPASPRIIAVAYADARPARTVSAELIFRSASQAAAAGVLIDTYGKHGSGLFDWISASELATWVFDARRENLLTAVAGGLTLEALGRVETAAPDVVGFRGAVCEHGRLGEVSVERVARIRRRLDESKYMGNPAYVDLAHGRKRDPGVIPAP